MDINILIGVLLPFLGTTLGSGCVLFLKNKVNIKIEKIFLGFSAGVMVAASIWSLILPAIEKSNHMGNFSFFPAAIGFSLGIILMSFLDKIISFMYLSNKRGKKIFFSVTLHNVPEGIAVGIVFAGFITSNEQITLTEAIAVSVGIAIQNFPEGAIISMPLKTIGVSKKKAFAYGVLSGIVEPVAAIITILLANIMIPILPYFLSFAAGAMFFVVIEELIPKMSQGKYSNKGIIAFMMGFVLMMILDVALG